MKRKPRKILSAVLLAVCILSAGITVRQLLDKQARTAAKDSAIELSHMPQETAVPQETTIPQETGAASEKKEMELPGKVWVPAPVEDDPQMEELAQINLDALRQVNPEVVGWIRIPDTDIDFPLTQTSDNTFYLEHTWDLVESSYGNIFLECMNNPDFTDFNTIVYGHHMRDGTMFAALRKYAEQEFYEAHPYVYIVTDAGIFRYEVFSSYFATLDSKTYGLSFHQEKTRVNFLNYALTESEIEAGITPATTDRILTLSTCTGWGYLYRRVVHARLEMVEVYETQKITAE